MSWTTQIQPGCTFTVGADTRIAYVNSTGPIKYTANACNYVADSFPGNTELLRPYAIHPYTGTNLLLNGAAGY